MHPCIAVPLSNCPVESWKPIVRAKIVLIKLYLCMDFITEANFNYSTQKVSYLAEI